MAKKSLDLLRENDQRMTNERLAELSLGLERHTYQNIPGTCNSFRIDSANTNTITERHAHVYAKPNGNGKELYSVNMSGKGHDGSKGTRIPKKHAEFFNEIGFVIVNLTLESLDYSKMNLSDYKFCVFGDDE